MNIKRILFGLNVLAFAILLNSGIVLASASAGASESGVYVRLNGLYVDVDAQIVDGRTLLPARSLVEMLGGDVDWDGYLRQVAIVHNNTHILLTIDNPTALINNQPIQMDVPPQIINGFTKVPLRFVADALGVYVDFYNGVVMIMTPQFNRLELESELELESGLELELDNVVIYYTPILQRLDMADVRLIGLPYEELSLSIRYATGYGAAYGLGYSAADEGGVIQWQWQIGSRTTFGSWPVNIARNGYDIALFYIEIVE